MLRIIFITLFLTGCTHRVALVPIATDTPMAVPSPTNSPAPTSTLELITTPEKSIVQTVAASPDADVSAYSEYLGEISYYLDIHEANWQNISKSFRDPVRVNDAWISAVLTEMALVEHVYVNLSQLDPPLGLEDLHESIVSVFLTCSVAADYIKSGIESSDASFMKTGANMLNKCNDYQSVFEEFDKLK